MAKGTLALRQIQLGDNADTSKNFVISVPAVADGTLVIERGNGTDVLTIDANGKVEFPGNVAETGSANGGTYWKYPDGTLICQWSTTAGLSGSLYASPLYAYPITFTFAVPFVGPVPVISAKATDQGAIGWVVPQPAGTLTTFAGLFMTKSTTVTSSSITITAIGRWK